MKRSGAERVFQRIGKEEEIRIHEVDVVCSTDAGHFVRWRREGLLAPFLPEDAARHLPPEQIGADGMYAAAFASLSPIGYNTNLVKPERSATRSEVRIILARGAKPTDLPVERMCYHFRPAQSLRSSGALPIQNDSPLARDLPVLCGEVSCGKPAGAGVGENHVGYETAEVYDAARQGSGGRRGLAAPCKSGRQPGDGEARLLHELS